MVRGFKDNLERIASMTDAGNRSSFNTVWGEQITAEKHADIEEQFQYNVNTATLTTTAVGNGAASQEDSEFIDPLTQGVIDKMGNIKTISHEKLIENLRGKYLWQE
jgi:hypothetical protein